MANGAEIPLKNLERVETRLDRFKIPASPELKTALEPSKTITKSAFEAQEKLKPLITKDALNIQMKSGDTLSGRLSSELYKKDFMSLDPDQKYFILGLVTILAQNGTETESVAIGTQFEFKFVEGTYKVTVGSETATATPLALKAATTVTEKSVADRNSIRAELSRKNSIYDAFWAYRDSPTTEGRKAFLIANKDALLSGMSETEKALFDTNAPDLGYKFSEAQNIAYLKTYLKLKESSGAVPRALPKSSGAKETSATKSPRRKKETTIVEAPKAPHTIDEKYSNENIKRGTVMRGNDEWVGLFSETEQNELITGYSKINGDTEFLKNGKVVARENLNGTTEDLENGEIGININSTRITPKFYFGEFDAQGVIYNGHYIEMGDTPSEGPQRGCIVYGEEFPGLQNSYAKIARDWIKNEVKERKDAREQVDASAYNGDAFYLKDGKIRFNDDGSLFSLIEGLDETVTNSTALTSEADLNKLVKAMNTAYKNYESDHAATTPAAPATPTEGAAVTTEPAPTTPAAPATTTEAAPTTPEPAPTEAAPASAPSVTESKIETRTSPDGTIRIGIFNTEGYLDTGSITKPSGEVISGNFYTAESGDRYLWNGLWSREGKISIYYKKEELVEMRPDDTATFKTGSSTQEGNWTNWTDTKLYECHFPVGKQDTDSYLDPLYNGTEVEISTETPEKGPRISQIIYGESFLRLDDQKAAEARGWIEKIVKEKKTSGEVVDPDFKGGRAFYVDAGVICFNDGDSLLRGGESYDEAIVNPTALTNGDDLNKLAEAMSTAYKNYERDNPSAPAAAPATTAEATSTATTETTTAAPATAAPATAPAATTPTATETAPATAETPEKILGRKLWEVSNHIGTSIRLEFKEGTTTEDYSAYTPEDVLAHMENVKLALAEAIRLKPILQEYKYVLGKQSWRGDTDFGRTATWHLINIDYSESKESIKEDLLELAVQLEAEQSVRDSLNKINDTYSTNWILSSYAWSAYDFVDIQEYIKGIESASAGVKWNKDQLKETPLVLITNKWNPLYKANYWEEGGVNNTDGKRIWIDYNESPAEITSDIEKYMEEIWGKPTETASAPSPAPATSGEGTMDVVLE